MIDFAFLRQVINDGAECVLNHRVGSMSETAEVQDERTKALTMIDELEADAAKVGSTRWKKYMA